MPTYVSLWNFTQDGIANVEESPDRLDEAKGLFEALGGELRDFYLTMGQYDVVIVAEFPNDEAASTANLTIAKGGTARSETLKAFSEGAFRDIVGDLPGESSPDPVVQPWARDWGRQTVRSTPRNRRALMATMMVERDMNTAPTAGERTTPTGARTPAASGSANTL